MMNNRHTDWKMNQNGNYKNNFASVKSTMMQPIFMPTIPTVKYSHIDIHTIPQINILKNNSNLNVIGTKSTTINQIGLHINMNNLIQPIKFNQLSTISSSPFPLSTPSPSSNTHSPSPYIFPSFSSSINNLKSATATLSATATTTATILSDLNNISNLGIKDTNKKTESESKLKEYKISEGNTRPSFLTHFQMINKPSNKNSKEHSPFNLFYINPENLSNKSVKSTKSSKSNKSNKSNLSNISNYSSSTNSVTFANRWTKSFKNQFNFDFLNSNNYNFSYGVNLTQTVFDYIKNVPIKTFTDTISNSINIPINFNKKQSINVNSDGRALIAKNRIKKTNMNINKLSNSLYHSTMISTHENTKKEIDFNDGYIVDGIDVENISEDGGISQGNLNNIIDLQEIQAKIETNSLESECILCQENFNNGDELLSLSCSHNFHSECITTWFVRKCLQGEGGGAFRCPICLLDPQKMDKSFISVKKNNILKSTDNDQSPVSPNFLNDSVIYDSVEDLNSLYVSMMDFNNNKDHKLLISMNYKKNEDNLFENSVLPSFSSVSSLSTSPSLSPSSNLSNLPSESNIQNNQNDNGLDDENISFYEDDILSNDLIEPIIDNSENAKLSLLLFVQNTIIEKGEYKFYSTIDSYSENNESISSTSSNNLHKTYSFCSNNSFNFIEKNIAPKMNCSNHGCSLYCSTVNSNCPNSNCIYNTKSLNSSVLNNSSSKNKKNINDLSSSLKERKIKRELSNDLLDWSLCTEDSEP